MTACERCAHEAHGGICGVDYEVQGIEMLCGCYVPTAASLDKYALRNSAADRERRILAAAAERPPRRRRV